ncbi:MAG: hypothetical protein E6R04_08855 [Spirochaetes bacterium]|jgi:hypothetical protein|nr:MAG: hypothetical protein E6R04_08855 [Spirochaetota bacterium]
MKVGDLVRCDCEFKRDGVFPFFGVIIDSWGTEFLVLVANGSIEHEVDCYWFHDDELELIDTST